MGFSINVPDLLVRLGIDAHRKQDHWWACCPFHEDKSPSWRMRDQPGHPAHGLHHCFACEAGGSHVFLVQSVLGFEEREDALAWIASGKLAEERLKLSVQVEIREARQRGGFVLPLGCEFKPLERWPAVAREYAESRCLTAEQIERWGIGFAREGRLRGRIVIPVRNASGKLISYTARAWGNRSRKYLEPREEERADKAAVWGEEHWLGRTIVVCEGALNALAIERALQSLLIQGVDVGALYGSQILGGAINRIGKFERVIVAADPDKAGDKMRVSLRGLARWCQLSNLHFPEGLDASDVERQRGVHELGALVASVL